MPEDVTREECLALAVHPDSRSAQQKKAVDISGIYCWHCCHPFDGKGIPMPMNYDSRRNLWKTYGTFCSFGCAKTWNWDMGCGYRSALRGQLLTLFRKKTTGNLGRITPAPPRTCLSIFGGTMSIDEFRSKSDSGIVVQQLPERMVPMEFIVHQRKVEAKKAASAPGANLQEVVDFGGATQKNETLRLKRPRPKASNSDILAKTMGLEIS